MRDEVEVWRRPLKRKAEGRKGGQEREGRGGERRERRREEGGSEG